MKNRWLVWVGISVLYHLILLFILSQVRFGTIAGKSVVIAMQLVRELPQKAQEIIENSSSSSNKAPLATQKTTPAAEVKKNIPAVQKESPAQQESKPEQKNAPPAPITAKDIFRPENSLPDYTQNAMNRNDYSSVPAAGSSSGMQKLQPGKSGITMSSGGGESGGNGNIAPDPGKMGSGKAAPEAGGSGGFAPSHDPGFFQFGQQLITSNRGDWSTTTGNGGNNNTNRMPRLSPGGGSRGNSGNGNGVGISNGNGIAPVGLGTLIDKLIADNNGNGSNFRGETNQIVTSSDSGNGRGNGYDKPVQVSSNPRGKISPGSIPQNSGTGNGVGVSSGNGVAPASTGTSVGKIASNATGNGAGYRGDTKIATVSGDTGNGRGNGFDKPSQQIASIPTGRVSPGAIGRADTGIGIGIGIGITATSGTGAGPAGGGISDRGNVGVIAGGFSFGHDVGGGKLMPGGNPSPGGRVNISDAPANGGGGNGDGRVNSSGGSGGVSYLAEISGISKIGKVPSIIEEENLLGRIPDKSCTVIADVKVGSSGQAMDVTLVKSTVFNTINNNAIYISRKIEYRPGMNNGIASPTIIRLEIKYIDGKTDPVITQVKI
jgi:hypothetical protein